MPLIWPLILKLTRRAKIVCVKYFVPLNEKQFLVSAIGWKYPDFWIDERHSLVPSREKMATEPCPLYYDLIKADKQSRFVRPIGEWNKGRIVVRPDNTVEHYINGLKVVEYTRGSEAYRELVADSKYKVWENFGEAGRGPYPFTGSW